MIRPEKLPQAHVLSCWCTFSAGNRYGQKVNKDENNPGAHKYYRYFVNT